MIGQDRDGIGRQISVDRSGIMIVRSSMMDAAMEGRLFSAANQTNITTTALMANGAWTGLGIYNPSGSGKELVFHEFGWHQEVKMDTEGGIGLFAATSTDAAVDIAVQGAKFGQTGSVAYAEEGCTIASAVLLRTGLGSSMEGTIATVPSLGPNIFDLGGSIVITPGYGLFTYTFAIQTSSLLFHFVWEEIDE